MKYCSNCGKPVKLKRIKGDHKRRYYCEGCDTVHYQNPKVLVSCIVIFGKKILLMRRALAPGKGKWCSPAGFMESDETLEEAAVRETFEETGVVLDPNQLDLHTITSLKDISEVYVAFRANVASDQFNIGPEALEAGWFDSENFPWEALAFAESYGFFKSFFEELSKNQFSIHMSAADSRGKYRVSYPAKGALIETKR